MLVLWPIFEGKFWEFQVKAHDTIEKYQQDLTRPDFHHDAAQEFAVKQLQRLFDDFVRRPPSTKPNFWQKVTGKVPLQAPLLVCILGRRGKVKPIWWIRFWVFTYYT